MIGFYYPDSHMWGTLFLHFFRELGLDFELIDTESLDKLSNIDILIVPGGFSSEKSRTLKSQGFRIIREYVKEGGIYIGICGGAGLALNHGKRGIGLCSLKRKDISKRVPNFSGHVGVELNLDSPFFENVHFEGLDVYLPVWWPSQFEGHGICNLDVLATYLIPGDDLWIADIPYRVLKHMDREEVEKVYGINMDFELIKSEPCIISGGYSKGRFLLTYPHLETPASPHANRLFVHILSFFLDRDIPYKEIGEFDTKEIEIKWDNEDLVFVRDVLLDLISRAEENFLVCWRKRWLLGWRRGVIGLSLNSLLCMCVFLLGSSPTLKTKNMWKTIRRDFLELFILFSHGFDEYIYLQREFYLRNFHRPPDRFESSPIHSKILELTGPFPGDGGLFKRLVSYLERLTETLF